MGENARSVPSPMRCAECKQRVQYRNGAWICHQHGDRCTVEPAIPAIAARESFDRWVSETGASPQTVIEVLHEAVVCLAAERDAYWAALDGLAHAAREFSAAAAYKVEVDIEEEFVSALADAEEALRDA